jgi:RND superfamily putative drug exporter
MTSQEGPPGARLSVILRATPESTAAQDQIPEIRAVVREAGGSGALVGGSTAEDYDLRAAALRDTRIVVPVALMVVLVILIALLRALVLPLMIIVTVIASFAGALGLGAVAFEQVFGFTGSDASLPLLAFVFLFALGVDYTIFLTARVREEAHRMRTPSAMTLGLAATGAVITSAGLVLAGTFAVLAVLPLVALAQVGFVIGVGVLLDTLLVRSVIVPALVYDAGASVWWPSRLARGHHVTEPVSGSEETTATRPHAGAAPASSLITPMSDERHHDEATPPGRQA